MRALSCTLSLLLVPALGIAHHSILSVYSRDSVSEVEGELSSVFWRNPHVTFSVVADSGEVWKIESAPPTELERYGITRELLREGDRIRVAGDPSRRTARAIFATNVLLPSGLEILTYPRSTPRWSSETLARGGERVISERDARIAEENADGVFRVWAGGFTSQWTVFPTEAALAARERWDPLRDDPTLRCVAPGMVEAMVSPYPIELTRDGGDIVIRMEQWDGVRRVHMEDATGAEAAPASKMGYSVGHWEDETLVVHTSRIDWPWFDLIGTPQSEAVEMVERFSIIDEGRRLYWEATISDPSNLTEPAVVRQWYDWIPGERIKPYDCTLADEAP